MPVSGSLAQSGKHRNRNSRIVDWSPMWDWRYILNRKTLTHHLIYYIEYNHNTQSAQTECSNVSYASPYKCGTRKCDLCLTEKMIIARSDPKKLLNKQSWFLNVDIETNFYWATSNKRCYITIKQYYEIQKPLTPFDFMIESRKFMMQHILIKDNSQGI